MKVLKLVAFVLMVSLLSTFLIACSSGKHLTEIPQQSETPPQDEGLTAVSRNEQTAKDVSIAFMEALATGDYEAALSLTEAYVENSFVFTEDLEWYLPRSSFASVQNLGFDVFKTKAEGMDKEDSAEYVVTLYDAQDETETPKEKSFTVKSLLNKENIWVVSVPVFV